MPKKNFEEEKLVNSLADFYLDSKKTKKPKKKKNTSTSTANPPSSSAAQNAQDQGSENSNIPATPTPATATDVSEDFTKNRERFLLDLIESKTLGKYNIEILLASMRIGDDVHPSIGILEINSMYEEILYLKDYWERQENDQPSTSKTVDEIFTPLRIIAKNIHDPEKTSFFIEENPTLIDQKSTKNVKSLKSIYAKIFEPENFNVVRCMPLDRAKDKIIQMAVETKKNSKKLTNELLDFTCNVCYNDESDDPTGFTLAKCQHYFCLECWLHLITDAMNVVNVPITCMENDCSCVVTPDILSYFFKSYLSKAYSDMLYDYRLLEKDIIPCKRCSKILFVKNYKSDNSKSKFVMCDCGQSFCANCKYPTHVPLSCDDMKAFGVQNIEMEEILGAIHYIDAVRCPFCKMIVEKASGCNYMHCKCGHGFCYACGNPWPQEFGLHNCTGGHKPIMVQDETILSSKLTEEGMKWHRKREYRNLYKIRKAYAQNSNEEQAMHVVSQYSQICQLIEYAHIKQGLVLEKKEFKPNFRLISKQFKDVVERLEFMLEKLTNPQNSDDEILAKIFNLLKELISLCNLM